MNFELFKDGKYSHTPYFSRWFSAIKKKIKLLKGITFVTILILVDGFLQLTVSIDSLITNTVTILILVDGFLQ